MKRFRFWRYNIPTGQQTEGEMDAIDSRQVLETLNQYNCVAAGVWQYWITPEQIASARWV